MTCITGGVYILGNTNTEKEKKMILKYVMQLIENTFIMQCYIPRTLLKHSFYRTIFI